MFVMTLLKNWCVLPAKGLFVFSFPLGGLVPKDSRGIDPPVNKGDENARTRGVCSLLKTWSGFILTILGGWMLVMSLFTEWKLS